ncbi:DUF6744 family protein [Sphaerisporangium sp. NPDC051011]|uniref:DUF6744 family protein n=1 Tax=Sphaerisporangium sp. NPDC051011 TaxID=3155792 RepID=UPI0033F39C02
MTTPTPAGSAEQGSAMETLSAFTTAMETSDAPALGHLVLYSVYESRVTRPDLERWFLQLGLDGKFLPAPIREDDAFQRVTGPSGVRSKYKLTSDPSGKPTPGEKVTEVTLMIRHVSQDNLRFVRHLVREVRDEGASRLSYDTRMAEVVFWRDPTESGRPGCGVLQVHPDHSAINALSEGEQVKVRDTLNAIEETFRQQCQFYSSDRLRSVVRAYVESLNALRVRASGGVYFVHRAHAAPLKALRGLVKMFGAGSNLTRIPLLDQEEEREMVIEAFTTKTTEELQQLSADIAKARAEGYSERKVRTLYDRFQALQASTAEHSKLLSTSLGDTEAAFELASKQVISLLAHAV